MPTGVTGLWALSFDDEFSGSSLDRSKWSPDWYGDGGVQNDVPTHASNVAVSGGNLLLTLASSNSGASVNTDPSDVPGGGFTLPVGGFAEARIDFPGNGTTIDNWPAWWTAGTDAGPVWPAGGETDIAEGLDTLTVNYHGTQGAQNQGAVPGVWANAFHVYGLHRLADHIDVFWDGHLVASCPTHDNGEPEILILNVGKGNTAVYGPGSQVKVDYVRAWRPL
jgi:hypothetical protein